MSEKEASWWRKWKKVKEEEFGIKIRLHDEDDLLDLLKSIIYMMIILIQLNSIKILLKML